LLHESGIELREINRLMTGLAAAGASRHPATTFPIAFAPAGLPGCLEVLPRVADDERGRFVKFFHAPSYAACGLEHDFAEAFYTTSRRGAIRGMHLQLPPSEQAKLVWCVAGAMVDVLLDLRRGSPTYGKHVSLELDESVPRGLYIPPGVAHGFCATSDRSILGYLVTSVHSPQHDSGVRWDSFGMEWPGRSPIVSARDAMLPALEDFMTPFEFADPADG
jgi:dTDP-4-dehydrorhamnose 3,5-epimerase